MKAETKERREREKQDRKAKAELLDNLAFQKFLRYLYQGATEVTAFSASTWLPGWIVTGCELYFTDDKVKDIVKLAS